MASEAGSGRADDQSLVRRWQAGEREAFEQLFARHHGICGIEGPKLPVYVGGAATAIPFDSTHASVRAHNRIAHMS